MTVEQQHHAPPAGLPVVQRHIAAMRAQRRWYAGVVTAVVIVLAAVVAVGWSRSEITHAHLHTASATPQPVARAALRAEPRPTWRSDDATAIGDPVSGGTIVTSSAHTITGRDARTGRPTWSYTRSDRTVCAVVQLQDRTIAIFEHRGNCDEVNAFTTATGRRAWERTLDSEGHATDGHPTVTAVVDTVVLTSDGAVHAIDPVLGYDRWNYVQPAGCRTRGVAVGAAGALIGQHCADGDYLVLRDRYANEDDQNKNTKWRIRSNAVPAAADSFLAAVEPTTGDLVVLDPRKGGVRTRTALRPRPALTGAVLQAPATTGELIWTGGVCYAADSSGSLSWATAALTVPSVTAPAVGEPVDLGGAILLAPSARGVVRLDGTTGAVLARYPTGDPPARARVVPFGTGFLVAGSTTAAFQ